MLPMLLSLLFQVALVIQPPSVPPPAPKVETPPKAPATDAEKIANTRDSIKQAKLAMEKMQSRLEDTDGEYPKAEKEFELLNAKLKDAKAMAAKLRKDGHEAEAVALEAMLPMLMEDWKLAKDRFDIAIRKKKATLETIAGMKERMESDQKLLDRLEGNKPPAPMTPPTTPVTPKNTEPKTETPPVAVVPKKPTPETKPETKPEAEKAAPTIPGLPGLPAAPAANSPVGVLTNLQVAPDESDPVLQQARQTLETRRVELKDAEARVHTAEERVRVMEQSIENATNMLNLEKEAADQAEKAAARLSTTFRTQLPDDPAQRDALAQKLMETEQRLADSRTRVQRIADWIAASTETVKGLKAELGVVSKEAEEKKARLEEADKHLNELLNPIAPRNLFRWAIVRGPRVLIIVIGMLLVHLLVRSFSRTIVGFITRNSQRGSADDRKNRASTLVGVFRYAAGVVVFGGGMVMLLDVIGVPIVPLMGGAAVIGLAVAFGAQNLIRDYFTGFMMLMEDQYSVNDVVKIGSIAGLVELITLRMTVLRDLEGTRHFVPHGTVTCVSNLTHGWSRAKLDVPIAYKENVDRAISVLMQIGKEMRLDPILGKQILEDPEMLGVDSLDDSCVTIRMLLKTRPLKQWPVKREMLRRIKNKFDELGIEIPFPHRTVYHRFPEGMTGLSIGEQEYDRSAA